MRQPGARVENVAELEKYLRGRLNYLTLLMVLSLIAKNIKQAGLKR